MNLIFAQTNPESSTQVLIDGLTNGQFPTALAAITFAGLVTGRLLKMWPSFPNKFIPVMLGLSGALADCMWDGWNLRHATYGFIWGIGATGIKELFTNLVAPPAVPTKVQEAAVASAVNEAIKSTPDPTAVTVEIKPTAPDALPQKP